MGKIRVGNKFNSFLNGEWAMHCRHRSMTSGLRRAWNKEVIREELVDIPNSWFIEDGAGDSKWLGDVCCESEGWENPETYQGHPYEAKKTDYNLQAKLARKRKAQQKSRQDRLKRRYYNYSHTATKPHKLSSAGYSERKNLWLN